MTLTVEWCVVGTVRTFPNLDQREVNKLITHVSKIQDKEPAGPIKITVK